MRNGALNMDMLEEFVYLADTLSYKRTADHFYVSKSVISRHMTSIEEQVGVRLLDRGSHGVALTKAGQVFYREAQTMLRDWDVTLERVRAAGEGLSSVVRIGYLRNAARPVLAPFANYMAMAHPEVRLSFTNMEFSELRNAIGNRSVDVAIAMNVNAAISRNYRSTPIYSDSFQAVCAPTHPLVRKAGRLKLKDLRGHKVLIPSIYMQAGLGALVDRLVDEETLESTQTFYQDGTLLALKILSEGYVAFMSTQHVAQLESGLVALQITDVNTSFSVSAFYHDDFRGTAYQACCEGFDRARLQLERKSKAHRRMGD